MTYFISYDIANPKRLYKISKVLENYGQRTQYSFFRCEVSKDMLEKLKGEIFKIMNQEEDSLLIYPVCSDCLEKSAWLEGNSLCRTERYQIL